MTDRLGEWLAGRLDAMQEAWDQEDRERQEATLQASTGEHDATRERPDGEDLQ